MLMLASISLQAMDFPKKLHFIWFGGAPYSENEVHVKKWIKANKDYDIFIWYSEKDLHQRYLENKVRDNGNKDYIYYSQNNNSPDILVDYLKRTYAAPNVLIVPIESLWGKINQFHMVCNDFIYIDKCVCDNLIYFFESELLAPLAPARNLAAASDIARVLILYFFGGVYFDFDVFSKESYALDVSPNIWGIKVNGKYKDYSISSINSNMLASVPFGVHIRNIAYIINSNYVKILSQEKFYDDTQVLNYYQALRDYLIKTFPDEYEEVLGFGPKSFAGPENLDDEKITVLQKKKFGNVLVTNAPMDMWSYHLKRRLTAFISGPEAINAEIKDMLRLCTLEEFSRQIFFPIYFKGPCSSPGESWEL